MKKTLITSTVLMALACMAFAMDEPKKNDNTAENSRDKTGETLTPIDQSNESEDIRLTSEIRKALVADDTLSSNAKNIKIITITGGQVNLRGPVDTLDEKNKIAVIAQKVAGKNQVTNQIEVAAK